MSREREREREREMLILCSYIVYTVMNTTFKGNLCQTHFLPFASARAITW